MLCSCPPRSHTWSSLGCQAPITRTLQRDSAGRVAESKWDCAAHIYMSRETRPKSRRNLQRENTTVTGWTHLICLMESWEGTQNAKLGLGKACWNTTVKKTWCSSIFLPLRPLRGDTRNNIQTMLAVEMTGFWDFTPLQCIFWEAAFRLEFEAQHILNAPEKKKTGPVHLPGHQAALNSPVWALQTDPACKCLMESK